MSRRDKRNRRAHAFDAFLTAATEEVMSRYLAGEAQATRDAMPPPYGVSAIERAAINAQSRQK